MRIKKFTITAACSATVIGALSTHAGAQTTYLYQGSGTATPQSQGYLFEYAPGVTPVSAGGETTFDSTSTVTLKGGYTNSASLTLNPTTGFTVGLTMDINAETHTSNDRGGFALIVLGSDKKGVELDFWDNDIWAQDYSPSTYFTRDPTEDVDAQNNAAFDSAFTTTGALNQYNLSIEGGSYFLTDNGTTILTGLTHDYTASGIAPYTLANYIFIGDDTTEASASETFSSLSVTVPEPVTGAGLITLGVAALTRRRRR